MISYTGIQGFYPQNTVFSLRDELHDLLFGDLRDPGVGQAVLIRRLSDTPCVCFKKDSGSSQETCRTCQGEGYLWTETLNLGYVGKNLGSVLGSATGIAQQNSLAKWGMSDDERALAYFEYDVFPDYERYLQPSHPSWDKLYELKVDENGDLVQPVVRTAKYKIKSVTPHRGDNGRIEIFECGLEKQTL